MSHKHSENCPICQWLGAHDNYEEKFLCGKECADCLQLHLDLPFDWLKSLKRPEGEFARTIELKIREYSMYNEGCLRLYAERYLAHILRPGDCLWVHSHREDIHPSHQTTSIIIMHREGNFRRLYADSETAYYESPYADIIDFPRADYFSKIAALDVQVWSEFRDYGHHRIERDKTHDYALWKMYKNFSQERDMLEHRLIPELADLIIAYLRDKWYVFSTYTEIIPNEPTAYTYDCDDKPAFLARLLSSDDQTICSKANVLYTEDFRDRYY